MIRKVDFSSQINHIFSLELKERQIELGKIHANILRDYLKSVNIFTEKNASLPANDGRTVAQVVGHIMEWERYFIQSLGEMLSGVERPSGMTFSGFVEIDGHIRNFTGVDEFNAYQEEKHKAWPWEKIRQMAAQTSFTLYRLYATPNLFPLDILDKTCDQKWTPPGKSEIVIPYGWFNWVIAIEHIVEHYASDLEIMA
ncbi:MAG: hypothetical protein JEZ06_04035 [Anaerolineaceae bacterium]|nr:hypothetical protein [Anaerolineaceae bacterium]